MGQLTLNLVAITIFTVTMASLFGPLIHLPPAVPAIAIVTVLGVAILDQTSNNGTLGNLLVNGLSRVSPEARQRVLHHEAGHFLIAELMEIPVTDYTLSAWEAWKRGLPGQGGVQFDTALLETTLATGTLPAQVLNRYCTVWMAGVAAEQWIYGEAIGGQDDRQKFATLGQQIQRPFQESQMRQRWATLQAKSLLEKHEAAYHSLVEAMEAGASVADCRAAIALHLTPTSPALDAEA